ELNPRTATFAAQRTGRTIYRINVEQLLPRGVTFDAVTLTDVLEHIPDPVRILRLLRQLLAPGGWIAVKVPCGRNQLLKERVRWLVGQKDWLRVASNLVHVNHFSPASLRLALAKAGFSRVGLTVAAPELPVTGPADPLLGRWSNRFRWGVYRVARALPGGVHTPLALNLQAYACNLPAGAAGNRAG